MLPPELLVLPWPPLEDEVLELQPLEPPHLPPAWAGPAMVIVRMMALVRIVIFFILLPFSTRKIRSLKG